jgi:hypothetical protein
MTPTITSSDRVRIDPNRRPCAGPPTSLPGRRLEVELDEWEPLTVGVARVVSIERVVRLATDWSSVHSPVGNGPIPR